MTAPSPERLRELHREWETSGTYEAQRDYEAAALEALPALLQQLAELQAKTACTLGVGDGSGQLFVHGDYESIKAAQGIIDKLAEREAEVAKWRERSEANERVRIEMMDRFNEVASDLRAAERRASDYQRKCAQLSDMLFGTPCADIRWQQEREHLVARAEAAERAREEATGLLRKIDGLIPGEILGTQLCEELDAFLAASGGA